MKRKPALLWPAKLVRRILGLFRVNELLLVPGNFEREKEDKKGKPVIKKNPRVTRIYVSQEETCYNGRASEFSS